MLQLLLALACCIDSNMGLLQALNTQHTVLLSCNTCELRTACMPKSRQEVGHQEPLAGTSKWVCLAVC